MAADKIDNVRRLPTHDVAARRTAGTPRRRQPAPFVALAIVLAVCGAGLGGCSKGGPSTPAGIDDPAAEKVADTVPKWFPRTFPPPRDGVIVSVIDDPSTDNDEIEFGRSVTWRVDRPYEDVLRETDTVLTGLGWVPTDRLATGDEQDSRRTSIYIENGTVEVIRVFTDANLKGVRVTVELPA